MVLFFICFFRVCGARYHSASFFSLLLLLLLLACLLAIAVDIYIPTYLSVLFFFFATMAAGGLKFVFLRFGAGLTGNVGCGMWDVR